MFSHILAEIIGTFVYVSAHHASESNPLITSISLFLAMTFFNQYAGSIGVSLNPLASLVSYITKEETFIHMILIILAQVSVALGIGAIFRLFPNYFNR
jgi:hypothetical protein